MNTKRGTDNLAEVMLYIAKKCEGDPSFGSTKLNKILFLADFYAHGALGDSITGATYMHWDRGPIPKERPAVEEQMRENKWVESKESHYFGYAQKRLVALRDPDISWLDEEALGILDRIVDVCLERNGTELSEMTHSLLPWRYTRKGETIKYSGVFCMKKKEPTLDDIEWAKNQVKNIGD